MSDVLNRGGEYNHVKEDFCTTVRSSSKKTFGTVFNELCHHGFYGE